jgi:thioester reductase-like protein
MGTLFFTGFPGFLGSELLPRVLGRSPGSKAACLIQAKFADLAKRRARELADAHPEIEGRIEFLEGDITRPGLGIGEAARVCDSVTEIYHLAAVYDLGVRRDLAMRVNVDGTRNMLDFAARCPALDRFQYVSTCYVSGTHAGTFSERDLEKGQRFHNFYEETKYLAEVEVQKRMRAGLPATIYRPSVVVGDSATGATQKYDGLYSVIRLMLRQPRVAIMPVVGDARKAEVNVVPRDFVVDAIAYLSGRPETRCGVYQLADPNPLTVDGMLRELARATGRTLIRVPLPLGMAKFSLAHVPGVQSLLGIPPDALDYFVHPAHYETAETGAALQAGGIRCPRVPEYARQMVRFVVANPGIGSAAMV